MVSMLTTHLVVSFLVAVRGGVRRECEDWVTRRLCLHPARRRYVLAACPQSCNELRGATSGYISSRIKARRFSLVKGRTAMTLPGPISQASQPDPRSTSILLNAVSEMATLGDEAEVFSLDGNFLHRLRHLCNGYPNDRDQLWKLYEGVLVGPSWCMVRCEDNLECNVVVMDMVEEICYHYKAPTISLECDNNHTGQSYVKVTSAETTAAPSTAAPATPAATTMAPSTVAPATPAATTAAPATPAAAAPACSDYMEKETCPDWECIWDLTESSCLACSDYMHEGTCPFSECVWDYNISLCFACGDFTEKTTCPSHQCTWDDTDLCDVFSFPCLDGIEEIPGGWLCDWIVDCEDGSDEKDCPTVVEFTFGRISEDLSIKSVVLPYTDTGSYTCGGVQLDDDYISQVNIDTDLSTQQPVYRGRTYTSTSHSLCRFSVYADNGDQFTENAIVPEYFAASIWGEPGQRHVWVYYNATTHQYLRTTLGGVADEYYGNGPETPLRGPRSEGVHTLFERFDDCFFVQRLKFDRHKGQFLVVTMLIIVDRAFVRHAGTTHVRVQTKVMEIVSQTAALFEFQLGITLSVERLIVPDAKEIPRAHLIHSSNCSQFASRWNGGKLLRKWIAAHGELNNAYAIHAFFSGCTFWMHRLHSSFEFGHSYKKICQPGEYISLGHACTTARFFLTLAHEVGHSLGASHTFDHRLPEVTFDPECLKMDTLHTESCINVSSLGERCLRWNDPWIRNNPYTSLGNHNFCRNPENSKSGPWCYVDHSAKKSSCRTATEFLYGGHGIMDYVDVTLHSDLTNQRMVQFHPMHTKSMCSTIQQALIGWENIQHIFTNGRKPRAACFKDRPRWAPMYCGQDGPWPPTIAGSEATIITSGTSVAHRRECMATYLGGAWKPSWTYRCDEHGRGTEYRGCQNRSILGSRRCMRWDHPHISDQGLMTNNQPHNFCRSLDGDSQPWCYVRLGRAAVWFYCAPRVTVGTVAKHQKCTVTKPIPNATRASLQSHTWRVLSDPACGVYVHCDDAGCACGVRVGFMDDFSRAGDDCSSRTPNEASTIFYLANKQMCAAKGSWPPTAAGHMASIFCNDSNNGYMTRQCKEDGTWDIPDTAYCDNCRDDLRRRSTYKGCQAHTSIHCNGTRPHTCLSWNDQRVYRAHEYATNGEGHNFCRSRERVSFWSQLIGVSTWFHNDFVFSSEPGCFYETPSGDIAWGYCYSCESLEREEYDPFWPQLDYVSSAAQISFTAGDPIPDTSSSLSNDSRRSLEDAAFRV